MTTPPASFFTHSRRFLRWIRFHIFSKMWAEARILLKIKFTIPRGLGVAALAAAFLLLAGCAQTGQMADQPRYDPLEASQLFSDGRSARPIPPGTVPYMGDESPNSPVLTGLTDTGEPLQAIPVPVDLALVTKGQERYGIYCTVCHGATGEGNGPVVPFGLSKPPSLLADNAKNLTNGDIFSIIENGRGKMFSYGYRVKGTERWAVIAYVRALQLKNGQVHLDQLTPDDLNQIGNQP